MRMLHCRGLSGPKKGCGYEEQQAAPLLTKLSTVVTSWPRSRSKSLCAESAGKGFDENSSGTEGELRRIGLSSRRTSGLISSPSTLIGKGTPLGLIVPIAISIPELQWASVWATVILPHCRALSG